MWTIVKGWFKYPVCCNCFTVWVYYRVYNITVYSCHSVQLSIMQCFLKSVGVLRQTLIYYYVKYIYSNMIYSAYKYIHVLILSINTLICVHRLPSIKVVLFWFSREKLHLYVIRSFNFLVIILYYLFGVKIKVYGPKLD